MLATTTVPSPARSALRALLFSTILAACAAACASNDGDHDDHAAPGAAGTAATGAVGSGAAAGSASAGAPASAGAGGSSVASGNTAGSSAGPAAGGAGSSTAGGDAAKAGAGGAAGSVAGSEDEPDDPEPGDDSPTTSLSGDGLIGWASVSGDGVSTTTGGDGGRTVKPTDAQELIDFAAAEEPLIIQLDGTFEVPQLRVASNKTIVGIVGDATIEGGVRIRGKSVDEMVSNVIVENVRVHGATSDTDGDAMHIYYAHHVWIDHCEFWDAPDGNLDIVHASSWVTVSWSKFWYSDDAPDPDHRFSNLVGHSDPNDEDEGRLKITFHHNWWADGVVERMPRVRYGDVHVFNNYYSAAGNNYAIGAAYESRLLIENNAFDGVNDPHIFYDDEPTAEIAVAGNAYEDTTGMQQMGQGASFVPPYDYEMDAADDVPSIVMQGAGPR